MTEAEWTCVGQAGTLRGTLRTFKTAASAAGASADAKTDDDDAAAEAREVVILCHGLFGKRDGAFLKQLAAALPVSSLRFDFRGNGTSDGVSSVAGYADEVTDLRSVVEAVRKEGWTVRAIIGHSRGANIVLLYGAQYRDVPRVVAIAPRFHMWRWLPKYLSAEQLATIESEGFINWESRGRAAVRVTREDVATINGLDMGCVRDIPTTVKVLLCHGLDDPVIPVSDAAEYSRCCAHLKLRLFTKNADHMFSIPAGTAVLIETVVKEVTAAA